MIFSPGDKVTYAPDYLADKPEMWEHGIVKRVNPYGHGYFVVYKCEGNWDRYEDYTAANTITKYLLLGWLDKEAYALLIPKGEKI